MEPLEILKCIGIGLLGYFFGSISFSVILTKLKFKEDVRSSGSGNAGATNVARVFGMSAGLMTLLCDVLKTVIPMLLGSFLLGDLGLAIGGIATILGHCFPIFFGFKGGKGVSVAAAVALISDWRLFLIAIGVFLIIAVITRYVSLGSIIAVTVYAVIQFLPYFEMSGEKLVLGVVVPAVVVFMHHSNIKRLLKGEETKFKPKAKKDNK